MLIDSIYSTLQTILTFNLTPPHHQPSDAGGGDGSNARKGEAPLSYSTFRGVRSLKHKNSASHQDGAMRKSSSLHDLTDTTGESVGNSLGSSRFLSQSGDRLDMLSTAPTPIAPSTGGYFTRARTRSTPSASVTAAIISGTPTSRSLRHRDTHKDESINSSQSSILSTSLYPSLRD